MLAEVECTAQQHQLQEEEEAVYLLEDVQLSVCLFFDYAAKHFLVNASCTVLVLC